jgi:hypothetical protein
MKLKKSIYALVFGSLFFVSCNNDLPKFNDKDAFVAFTNTSVSVAENVSGGEIDIPVILTSLSGLEKTVGFTIKDSTAISGTNFQLINSSKTLTFTKDETTQYIKLKIIDNSTYNGDVVFTINLNGTDGLNLGESNSCLVKIADDEHPLAFILGKMSASGTSNFNGATTWNLTFEKDASDVSKVWIYNLVPGGSSDTSPVYGTVNADKTEIHIPVKQVIAISSSYPKILLEGFYGPSGDDAIPTGSYITGKITSDGTITIQDWFGSHVYKDAAATTSAGWYELMESGCVFKKQ